MSVNVRPRVKDLTFQVFGRPLHPEFFDILAQKKIRRDDYDLSLQITQTGHIITWDSEDVCLAEVAATTKQLLPEKRRLLRCRMRGEHSRRLQCAHGVCYQASFQVETLKPEVFLHFHDELLADGDKRGLLHNFQPNHRLAISPLSLIAAETKRKCLMISTFHTFPAENTVVKSQTLIERNA